MHEFRNKIQYKLILIANHLVFRGNLRVTWSAPGNTPMVEGEITAGLRKESSHPHIRHMLVNSEHHREKEEGINKIED